MLKGGSHTPHPAVHPVIRPDARDLILTGFCRMIPILTLVAPSRVTASIAKGVDRHGESHCICSIRAVHGGYQYSPLHPFGWLDGSVASPPGLFALLQGVRPMYHRSYAEQFRDSLGLRV